MKRLTFFVTCESLLLSDLIKKQKSWQGDCRRKECVSFLGGPMSDDNLILFPKKSTSNIMMSESEAKWMVAGSLLVVLTVAIGINSTLFASKINPQQVAGEAQALIATGSRAPASINPLFRVSWEKKAFEVLKDTKARDLANVGEKPSVFDSFAIGTLEGHYNIRKIDGKIAEVQFAQNENNQPKSLLERQQFLSQNLGLFSDQAKSVEQVHVEENADRLIERFRLMGAEGQDLGTVQVLLDKDQNLLSMTVQ